jgi:acetyl-CoA carboxylase carboxyl transferase subunit alpha
VISPEGCASILWKDQSKVAQAAAELKLTAADLSRLGICDEIIKEGPGGAHRDLPATAENLREALKRHLDELCALAPAELVARRYDKYRVMGVIEEI